MKQYIGTKLINAEPMTRGEYNIYRGWQIPENENPEDAGYHVIYSDNYESWSPAEVFEKSYLQLDVNADLRTDNPSISKAMVDNFIAETEVITMGEKTTVVRAVLINGFEIIEASSCVSVENYDEKLGAEICLGRIKNKIWQLLGFLLQTAVNGISTQNRKPFIIEEKEIGYTDDSDFITITNEDVIKETMKDIK